MAISKATTRDDPTIVNGLAAVNQGDKTATYDGHAQKIASGDALEFFVNINQRYRVHGGQNSSGNWEH